MNPQIANQLLLQLSSADEGVLRPCMELVDLSEQQVIQQANRDIDFVYFPETALISLQMPLRTGGPVELATVGKEGMIGLSIVLQSDSAATRAVVQFPGKGWRIDAADFRNVITTRAAVSNLLLRYAQSMFSVISVTAACNLLHTIEKRCARQLLTLHDRTGRQDDVIPVTQETLSQMLGVQRSGISLAASSLRNAALIRCTRGRVTILNRSGLEAASCECYEISTQSAILANQPTKEWLEV